MPTTSSNKIDNDALLALAREAEAADPCVACEPICKPGWESLPSSFDRHRLRLVGTIRENGPDDPTLDEYHPHGTHGWSADAPIAPAYFPYNRCDVWQCKTCRRTYLRYTEYGGYYEDERVRWVDPALVVRTDD